MQGYQTCRTPCSPNRGTELTECKSENNMLRISCRISSMLDRRKKCLRPPCHRSLSNPNSTFTRSSSTIRWLSLALPNNSSKVPIPSLLTPTLEGSYFYRSRISNSSSSKQSNQIYNYPQLFQEAHMKGQ